MKDDIKEFEKLIQKKDELKEERIRAEGEIKALQDVLKEKYSLDTPEQIEERIEDLQKKIEEHRVKIKELIDEIKEGMDSWTLN